MTNRNSYFDDELVSSGNVEQDMKDVKSDLRRQELGKPGVGADGALSVPYPSGASSSVSRSVWGGAPMPHHDGTTKTIVKYQRAGQTVVYLDGQGGEFVRLLNHKLADRDDVENQHPNLSLAQAIAKYNPTS